MRRTAGRLERLGTETAFEVLAKARALEAQGRDIVHLEIGEPDFDTPAAIVAAGVQALVDGETHYTASSGIPELREAIAGHIARTRGIDVDPARVIVTPGAKPIMFFAVLALLEQGDEAIYPDPGFPIYSSMIDFVGARPVALPLREAADFQPDLDELRRLITPRTKLLIINSPNNPTGSVLSARMVKDLAAIAREHDLWVLSDEIYADILYDSTHHSIAAEPGMAERTILLDGFSKTFAMTGWRLGYGIFPRPLVAPVTKLISNSVSCTATFVQRAGVAALAAPQPEVGHMLREFRERRDLLVRALARVPGVRCPEPDGAFYVFPNIAGLGLGTAQVVADRLLNEAGVAALAGTCFGRMGEGHLRFSYATSVTNLERAVDRFAAWTARRTVEVSPA